MFGIHKWKCRDKYIKIDTIAHRKVMKVIKLISMERKKNTECEQGNATLLIIK